MSTVFEPGLPDAARRLGVHPRILKHAIRTGKVSAPPQGPGSVPDSWVAEAGPKVAAAAHALNGMSSRRVPEFARFEGTSAWQQFPRRARAYARFKAARAAKQA